jgi:hypothetical protein
MYGPLADASTRQFYAINEPANSTLLTPLRAKYHKFGVESLRLTTNTGLMTTGQLHFGFILSRADPLRLTTWRIRQLMRRGRASRKPPSRLGE